MSLGEAIVRAIGAVVGPDSMVGSALRRFVGRPIATAGRWIDESINGVLRGILPFAERRMALLAVLSLVAVATISAVYWDETEQIRNIGLAVAAIIALPVAIWRSRVAEQQVDVAQQGVLNERYQKSAEMLGSEVLSVRLGGIIALERLALEHPAQHHTEVMKLLFAFIRQPIEDQKVRNDSTWGMRGGRSDVLAAIDAVKMCRSQNRKTEANSLHVIDLRGADLQQTDLSDIDLSIELETESPAFVRGALLPSIQYARADLSHANLSNARLKDATLSRCFCDRTNFTAADLSGADLTGAGLALSNLRNAILSNATFKGADLSGAEFAEATPGEADLTQQQLDEACADPDAPPKLVDMFDAKTGEPLVWRGAACDDSHDS